MIGGLLIDVIVVVCVFWVFLMRQIIKSGPMLQLKDYTKATNEVCPLLYGDYFVCLSFLFLFTFFAGRR